MIFFLKLFFFFLIFSLFIYFLLFQFCFLLVSSFSILTEFSFFFFFINIFFPLFITIGLILFFHIGNHKLIRVVFLTIITISLLLEIFFITIVYLNFGDMFLHFDPSYLFINFYFSWRPMSSFLKICMLLIFFFLSWFMFSFDFYGVNSRISIEELYFLNPKSWKFDEKISIDNSNSSLTFTFLFLYISLSVFILIPFVTNWLLVFILLQVNTICILVLLNFQGLKSKELLFKYFLFHAFNECILLLGIVLLYLLFNNFSMLDIINIILNELSHPYDLTLKHPYEIGLAFFLIIISIMFKIGLFPFHFWFLDLFIVASPQIMAFMTTIPKFVYFYLFYHVWITMNCFFPFFCLFFIFLMSVSFYFSITKASLEYDLYWLFAYSGIGHTSFAILPFIFCYYDSPNIFLYFYLIIYSFTVVGLFLLFSNSFDTSKFKDLTIIDLNHLFFHNKNSINGLFCLFYFLSLSGLPLFLGFLAKILLFKFFVSGYYFLLVVFRMSVHIFSFLYVLRIMRISFFDDILPYLFHKKDLSFDIYHKLGMYFYVHIILILFIFILTGFFVFFFPLY